MGLVLFLSFFPFQMSFVSKRCNIYDCLRFLLYCPTYAFQKNFNSMEKFLLQRSSVPAHCTEKAKNSFSSLVRRCECKPSTLYDYIERLLLEWTYNNFFLFSRHIEEAYYVWLSYSDLLSPTLGKHSLPEASLLFLKCSSFCTQSFPGNFKRQKLLFMATKQEKLRPC